MEKLPPLGFVPLLLSRYLKKAAAGSSASHQPRTTSSDHSTDDGNTHVTHRHHDSSGVNFSPQAASNKLQVLVSYCFRSGRAICLARRTRDVVMSSQHAYAPTATRLIVRHRARSA